MARLSTSEPVHLSFGLSPAPRQRDPGFDRRTISTSAMGKSDQFRDLGSLGLLQPAREGGEMVPVQRSRGLGAY